MRKERRKSPMEKKKSNKKGESHGKGRGALWRRENLS